MEVERADVEKEHDHPPRRHMASCFRKIYPTNTHVFLCIIHFKDLPSVRCFADFLRVVRRLGRTHPAIPSPRMPIPDSGH